MPVTVQQVVDAVITELSLVSGTSTQIYATPRIERYVQNAFDFCYEATWWNIYTGFYTGTLDGTTGRLTADIMPIGLPSASVPITNYADIGKCYVANTNRLIRELPSTLNPDVLANTSAGEPFYRASDMVNPNAPIRFYPVNATGGVTMRVRQTPLHPFALTDLLYLDELMLVLGASYMYAADDGTNPGQINKFQSMFMKRLTDMVAAEGDASIPLDPRYNTGTGQWWERY